MATSEPLGNPNKYWGGVGGHPGMDKHPDQGGVVTLLVDSCHRPGTETGSKLQPWEASWLVQSCLIGPKTLS